MYNVKESILLWKCIIHAKLMELNQLRYVKRQLYVETASFELNPYHSALQDRYAFLY